MIEKRTLWIVDRYDQEIDSVAALYDMASNKVLAFKFGTDPNGHYSSPHKNTKFYETQEEAKTALQEHRKWLREMMPKVKEFLDEIEGLTPTDDFTFERRDYLPYHLLNDADNCRNRFFHDNKMVNILTKVCRYHTLCINGCTFPLSQVRRINWYRDKAELELSDGSFGGSSTVATHNDEEFEVVKILFDDNTSGTTFKR